MTNPRAKIVEVARRSLGVREVSTNRSPAIAEFWKLTNYQEGMANREPWCCAAVVYWIQVADKETDGFNLKHPPKMAGTATFLEWANDPANGCVVFHEGDKHYEPQAGDVICFRPHLSHIGIVEKDNGDGTIETIEGNTGPGGGREGDGVYEKTRRLASFPGCSIIRIPASAV